MPDSTNSTSGFSQLLAELKRRHVVRFALGYAAAAFVVLQLAEIVFPAFGFGEGGLRLLVVGIGLGFPPSLVLAWMYDLTTEGLKRTTEGNTHGPLFSRLAVSALLVATVGAAGAVGLYLDQAGVFDDVASGDEARPTPLRLATYDPDVPIRSIAVLPFADYSPDGDQAYFTAGLHDEVIAKLSGLSHLRVVSRTSVQRYAGTTLSIPEIGQDLDVDVVVEGSVTRSGTRTRVTLQVIHAPSEAHIETLQWDREDITDILAFQSEVAHEVVHRITPHDEAQFVRTASSVDPEAQDAFLRGRYEYERGTADGYRTAVELFGRALEEDPDFAPAMAGLAGARFLMGLEDTSDASADLVSRAHGEAMSALAMDSTSVEAIEVLTLIERNMPTAARSTPAIPAPTRPPVTVQLATFSDGMDSVVVDMSAFDTAWVSAMTSLGERIEERVRQRRAQDLGAVPTRSVVEARQRMLSGRYTEAARQLEVAVREDPDLSPAWEMLAGAHVAAGEPLDAVDVIDRWSRSGAAGAPGADQLQALHDSVATAGVRGYWAWELHRLEERRANGGRVSAVDLAAARAALGDTEGAFAALHEALEAGDPALLGLRANPLWDDLRSDPRFVEIARRAQELRLGARRPPRTSGQR